MSDPAFAVIGRLDALDTWTRRRLVARGSDVGSGADVRAATAAIIERVGREGDRALREIALELDQVRLDAIEVPRRAWEAALGALDPRVRDALVRAADNIRAVHTAFLPRAQQIVTDDGVGIGRRPDPLRRVGVYAPGGRASYPSSLLMGAVPARVAGVEEVIVCSPPGDDGRPRAVVLAAAAIAGVDRLFAVGGAGAVAAMALGTATIPAVDRIVGPGNAYVAEAKLQLSDRVGIDSPAGPSELMIIADDAANAPAIADEMLAQAEHDPLAAVVLVALSAALADDVRAELARRVARAPRARVILAAFAARGALLVAGSLDAAIAFANEYAPEHLLLALPDDTAERALTSVRGAGTVFLGEAASVAFGDYLTGANHVLPTGGSARAFSGLSPLDFVRWTTWQRLDADAARSLACDTAVLADAEGLPAHAAAARRWEARA